MELYRGIKNSDVLLKNLKTETLLVDGWRKILDKRSCKDLSYPEEMNELILKLSKSRRLNRQTFTNNKDIAESYTKSNSGALIQIDIEVDDILEYFVLEFQNFAKRRKRFEIVYEVSGIELARNAEKWELRVNKF